MPFITVTYWHHEKIHCELLVSIFTVDRICGILTMNGDSFACSKFKKKQIKNIHAVDISFNFRAKTKLFYLYSLSLQPILSS